MRVCQIVDFAGPRSEKKESEIRDKFLDLARKLKTYET